MLLAFCFLVKRENELPVCRPWVCERASERGCDRSGYKKAERRRRGTQVSRCCNMQCRRTEPWSKLQRAVSGKRKRVQLFLFPSFFLFLFNGSTGKSNKERLFADFPGRRGETERVVCYAMRASEACMYVGIFTLIGGSFSVVPYLRKQTGKEEKKIKVLHRRIKG